MINLNKQTLIQLFKYLLVLELILVSLLFAIGGQPFYFAPLTAVTVSIPLLLNYLLIHIYKSGPEKSTFILFWGFAGAYIVNLAVAYSAVFLYMPGIISTKSIGPAEGYWLLFTLGFAVKYSIYGLVIGALSSLIYLRFSSSS
ncbi:MAG: hypothetical protein OEY61_14155 [Gammaproteobacteria bacterium]|nr:hypothetical protein [Gammaproteobacteria bacterium]